MTPLAERVTEARPGPAGLAGGRWVEVLPHLDPAQGGLSAVVPQLSAELVHRQGTDVQLAVFEDLAPAAGAAEPAWTLTRWPASRLAWMRDGGLRARFRELVAGVDGVHVHGLWTTHAATAAQCARDLDKPYVVSAHGMLEPWALAQKRWKKRLYHALVERRTLEDAACLHALTSSEAQDYRRFGCRAPIAVIPNAVNLPETIDRDLFLSVYPEARGRQLVLFLGRLHPKKGVDTLLRAWSALTARFPDALLVFAGPDAENTRSALEALAAEKGLTHRVLFTGMLQAAMKWSALAAASCFVLPSYSEGLSVAVLEALGVGVPVIVSDACNMPEVREAAAGWEIAPDLAGLTLALEELLSSPAGDLATMGRQGRALVEEKFSWSVVSRQMAELYTWVQGGSRPVSVEIQGVPA